MGEGREEMGERGRKEGGRWVMAVCELLSVLCSEHYATFRS